MYGVLLTAAIAPSGPCTHVTAHLTPSMPRHVDTHMHVVYTGVVYAPAPG